MPNQSSQSNRPQRQKGQALVEFALISPILLLAMMAIIDFSHAIVSYVQGVGALREATRYAEVVGYVAEDGGTPRYLDCDGMEASARKVILVDDHQIEISYLKKDGVTTYTCDTVSAGVLENGDMLRISSTARVDFFTPLITNIIPSLQMNFRGQRTIIKDVTLGLSYDVDSDFDGLLDSWELTHFPDLSYIATDNLDGDQCNLGCEENRGMNPYLADTDGDDLLDHEEAYEHSTDGTKVDTDGDSLTTPSAYSLSDFIEVDQLRDFSAMPADDPDTRLCYTSPIVKDTDGDGLDDGVELTYTFNGLPAATNPCDVDTDNDGLQDYDEIDRNTDGTNEDTDGDGLQDRDEIDIHLTNPLLPDTDGDTLSDGYEVNTTYDFSGASPLGTPDFPTCQTDPNDPDTDDDTISDPTELAYLFNGVEIRLNPCDADWDNDALLDGEEAGYAANPKKADTDEDGLIDSIEAKTVINDGTTNFGACMLPGDMDKDTDNDGLTDYQEFTYDNFLERNPCLYDTDGNGVSDGEQFTGVDEDADDDTLRDTWEIGYFGNITTYGAADDPDGDGLTNTQEHPLNTGTFNYAGTNPMLPDTDSDGLGDSLEYVTVFDADPNNNLNPNNPDTDVDGLYDGYNANTNLGENMIPAPYTDCDTNPLLQDSDDPSADGIKDKDELTTVWSSNVNGVTQSETFVLNPCAADTDLDGLYDGINSGNGLGEMLYINSLYPSCKTHPNRSDTDGDGLGDSGEIAAGTNPCDSDTDDDGLNDNLEVALRTVYSTLSATDSDSDDDNFTDFEEYCDRNAGTDVPSGYVNPKAVCAGSTDPAWDTSPIVADTDGDGRLDGNERKQSADPFYITDPMDSDTDDDGVSDGQEMTNGTKPNNKITVNIAASSGPLQEPQKKTTPAVAMSITIQVVNNNSGTPNYSSGSTETIAITWSTSSGCANANAGSYAAATHLDQANPNGPDYNAVTTTLLTIPANASSATVQVWLNGDNIEEDAIVPGEYFCVGIAAAAGVNAQLGTTQGVGLIGDND